MRISFKLLRMRIEPTTITISRFNKYFLMIVLFKKNSIFKKYIFRYSMFTSF